MESNEYANYKLEDRVIIKYQVAKGQKPKAIGGCYKIIPAPTVSFVPSSIRIKLPVILLRRY